MGTLDPKPRALFLRVQAGGRGPGCSGFGFLLSRLVDLRGSHLFLHDDDDDDDRVEGLGFRG